ncbi:MAG TPA: hypothetical protein VH108_12680, partial [Gaiellaceae bacterium]|nr:hypothetical protein [Gaiellaceae bacterium]
MIRRNAVAIGFLFPAAVLLSVWIIYPTIFTFVSSFYGHNGFSWSKGFGQGFVGFDNYKALFTTSILVTAIKNSAIW